MLIGNILALMLENGKDLEEISRSNSSSSWTWLHATGWQRPSSLTATRRPRLRIRICWSRPKVVIPDNAKSLSSKEFMDFLSVWHWNCRITHSSSHARSGPSYFASSGNFGDQERGQLSGPVDRLQQEFLSETVWCQQLHQKWGRSTYEEEQKAQNSNQVLSAMWVLGKGYLRNLEKKRYKDARSNPKTTRRAEGVKRQKRRSCYSALNIQISSARTSTRLCQNHRSWWNTAAWQGRRNEACCWKGLIWRQFSANRKDRRGARGLDAWSSRVTASFGSKWGWSTTYYPEERLRQLDGSERFVEGCGWDLL